MVLRFINKAKEIVEDAELLNTKWAYLQAEDKLNDLVIILEENFKMGIVTITEKELIMKKLLEIYLETLEKRYKVTSKAKE